jgi:uncharacterized membrane protein
MNAAISHPLAAAYLRDLEMLLHGLDPGARTEVLTGVREHLSIALGPDADGDQVQAALAELGSPQSIADEAYADQRPTGPPAPSLPPPRWQAITASALNGAGLAYMALISSVALSPADVLGAAPMFALPWVAVITLSLVSPAWNARQMGTSIGLWPATLLGVALLGGASFAVFGPSLINVIPVLAVFAAAAWILVRLARQGMRRSPNA